MTKGGKNPIFGMKSGSYWINHEVHDFSIAVWVPHKFNGIF